MEYVKHNWEYYKKVDIATLEKDELVELIKNAEEWKPQVIVKEVEKYVESKKWEYQPSPYGWLQLNQCSTS